MAVKIGGALRNMGYSKRQLGMMYYLICVVVRLGLAWSVWRYGENHAVMGMVLIFSAMSSVINLRGIMRGDMVWWSRKFHMLISIFIACVALFTMIGYLKYSMGKSIAAGLMVFDVLAGIAVSLIVRPFC